MVIAARKEPEAQEGAGKAGKECSPWGSRQRNLRAFLAVKRNPGRASRTFQFVQHLAAGRPRETSDWRPWATCLARRPRSLLREALEARRSMGGSSSSAAARCLPGPVHPACQLTCHSRDAAHWQPSVVGPVRQARASASGADSVLSGLPSLGQPPVQQPVHVRAHFHLITGPARLA